MGPVRWVNVRVFFKRDDDIGVVSQCLSDTAVQIELDTDDGIRANNFSDSLGQISFTIVITVGDHGTMQAE